MRKLKLSKVSALLTLLIVFGLFGIPLAHASTIVDHYNLTGDNGRFQTSIYVYKADDTVPDKDFYAIRVFVHCHEWTDKILMEITSQNGICDYWKPTGGWQGGGSIGFSYSGISFSITLPLTYIHQFGGFEDYIQIQQGFLFSVLDTEFATGWWVPEGEALNWKIRLFTYVHHSIGPIGWDELRDRLSFEPPMYLHISASSGGTTYPTPGTYPYGFGSSVSVTPSPYTNYRFSYWRLDGQVKYCNPITVTMTSDHTLKAYFSYIGGGGGGGCPILYVYDGVDYIEEGLLDIHNPEGLDVIHRHAITTTIEVVHNKVLLRLVEHPKTHSHIDNVKLYVIDEDDYITELQLTEAVHSEDGNVLLDLLFSDDKRTDTEANESIDLAFQLDRQENRHRGRNHRSAKGFIFVIEGHNIEFK